MSAIFILEYAGCPIRFTQRFAETVLEHEATQFTSEQDAWYAAYEASLSPQLCRVRCLSAEQQTTKH